MSTITIVIRTDNTAFGETETDASVELGHMLRELAAAVTYDGTLDIARTLLDGNGNACGTVTVKP